MTDVWILGAAGRIGALISSSLAASGASVVLCGRSEQKLRSLAEKIGGNSRVVVTETIDDIKAQLSKAGPGVVVRSEERRVGKGGVSTCRSWWSPNHKKKK